MFTGRFNDTLYFRDAFDNEIELHIKDYLFDDGSVKSIMFFTARPKTLLCTKLTINEARKIVPRLNK